ncbi:MAG TPA: hypothetical protein VNW92_19100 [Polyangiaceae bacterium]|jgi:hypothetical protein|nr:hypothetical protein [Polyangiaceae bacterium]
MKRRIGLLWATFSVTLLGFSSVAYADDAPVGADLESGGLKPPAPVAADASQASPSQPEAQLDLAKQEDSGRGLEFVWLNADIGGEYLGLQTLQAKQLVDSQLVKSKGLGAVYGAGLGVRLLLFTVGARFRLGNFEDWQMWTLNAEAGLRIPIGRVEPYFTFGGGYASLGDFKGSAFADSLKSANVKANGLDLRAGAGVDVYLTNTFSVGANLSGEVVFLGRSGSSSLIVPVPAGTPQAEVDARALYGQHGSGIGAGATLSAVLGLHF